MPDHRSVAPAAVGSIISLLANVSLIGGARQSSRRIVLFWIVWHFLLAATYWAWYAYSMLKYYGYIDSSELGLRRCYWCDRPEAESLGGDSACAITCLNIEKACFLSGEVMIHCKTFSLLFSQKMAWEQTYKKHT